LIMLSLISDYPHWCVHLELEATLIAIPSLFYLELCNDS